MKYEDYIVIYDEAIPKQLCHHIIEKFENSSCKSKGLAATVDGQVENESKRSTEILVGECLEFEDIDKTQLN